jgi:hypothetical protein
LVFEFENGEKSILKSLTSLSTAGIGFEIKANLCRHLKPKSVASVI